MRAMIRRQRAISPLCNQLLRGNGTAPLLRCCMCRHVAAPLVSSERTRCSPPPLPPLIQFSRAVGRPRPSFLFLCSPSLAFASRPSFHRRAVVLLSLSLSTLALLLLLLLKGVRSDLARPRSPTSSSVAVPERSREYL